MQFPSARSPCATEQKIQLTTTRVVFVFQISALKLELEFKTLKFKLICNFLLANNIEEFRLHIILILIAYEGIRAPPNRRVQTFLWIKLVRSLILKNNLRSIDFLNIMRRTQNRISDASEFANFVEHDHRLVLFDQRRLRRCAQGPIPVFREYRRKKIHKLLSKTLPQVTVGTCSFQARGHRERPNKKYNWQLQELFLSSRYPH